MYLIQAKFYLQKFKSGFPLLTPQIRFQRLSRQNRLVLKLVMRQIKQILHKYIFFEAAPSKPKVEAQPLSEALSIDSLMPFSAVVGMLLSSTVKENEACTIASFFLLYFKQKWKHPIHMQDLYMHVYLHLIKFLLLQRSYPGSMQTCQCALSDQGFQPVKAITDLMMVNINLLCHQHLKKLTNSTDTDAIKQDKNNFPLSLYATNL